MRAASGFPSSHWSRDLVLIAKCIRCPKTQNAELKKEKNKLRREVKLLIERVLDGMLNLANAGNAIDFSKVQIKKEELVGVFMARRQEIDEVAEEAEVVEEVDVDDVPDEMYT